MISYEPFWNTLKERNISTYQLINKQESCRIPFSGCEAADRLPLQR